MRLIATEEKEQVGETTSTIKQYESLNFPDPSGLRKVNFD
jgi:hypothetical protein